MSRFASSARRIEGRGEIEAADLVTAARATLPQSGLTQMLWFVPLK
jgi:hypothetical protein